MEPKSAPDLDGLLCKEEVQDVCAEAHTHDDDDDDDEIVPDSDLSLVQEDGGKLLECPVTMATTVHQEGGAHLFSPAPPTEQSSSSFCSSTLSICPQETYGHSPTPTGSTPRDPVPEATPLQLQPKVVSVAELQPLQVKFTQVYTTQRHPFLQYPALPTGGGTSLRLEEEEPLLAPPVTKKKRTLYSTEQLEELERMFQEDHYPDSDKRKEIAAVVGVTPQRIMVWFQNRRAKWRKAECSGVKPERRQTRSNSATLARSVLHDPRLAIQPHYSTFLPSSSPAGPVSAVPSVALLPPQMQSPPPLRRASLPVLTSYPNPTHLAPLPMDTATDSAPSQPDSGSSSSAHFDYSDMIGGSAKGDAHRYLQSYQLGSYPQPQHAGLAQYSRLSYLQPDSNPAPYLPAGGVVTYTSGGHALFQAQSGSQILLQSGVHVCQSCPWGEVYTQPGQFAPVYHHSQSMYPAAGGPALLPPHHYLSLQRPTPGPGPTPTLLFQPPQKAPASSAVLTHTHVPRATPDSAPKPGYEVRSELEESQMAEAQHVEADDTFDFSPIHF